MQEKVTVSVSPGICGFTCRVTASRTSKKTAAIEIIGSECEMINELAAHLRELTMQDLFQPHTVNPVFICTEQASCHLCCPVPIAVIKVAEVALELALPQDVQIRFE